jgi:hypothetical protein
VKNGTKKALAKSYLKINFKPQKRAKILKTDINCQKGQNRPKTT